MASGTINPVDMTDSFTRCCTRLGTGLARLASSAGVAVLALALIVAPGPMEAQTGKSEVAEMRLERQDDGLHLSALIRFELTAPVEDALNKGVPMFFLAEADVMRERWYWTDQKAAGVSKTFRLAYQPLTRRWRLNATAGAQSEGGGALSQHFDTLPEALATMRRITAWKIAEKSDLASGARHRVDFSFKLDVAQLPRPFQIGAVGQAEWNIAASASLRLNGDAP